MTPNITTSPAQLVTMATRLTVLGLLLSVVCGFWIWRQRVPPCHTPVAYKIGQLDPRFYLDDRAVYKALRQAERLWETAAGRNLFVQTSTAPLTVNFVFDERQNATQAQQRLLPQLQQAEATHASLAQSYLTWRRTYEEQHLHYTTAQEAHRARLQAYNAEVDQWNAQGGAPLSAQQTLAAERSSLEADQSQLRALTQEIREIRHTLQMLEEQDKTLITTYTRKVRSYNWLSRSQRQFHKGEFNGTDITIYQFRGPEDLLLVLAHELGHALGLKHVADEEAVMHEFLSEQDLDPLTLTAADLQALTAACGPR